MLDFDAVLELMKKYGYSSTSIHPYIYQNGENIGICYTYIDDEYGLLERVKIFDNIEALEEFLKEQSWLKSNGKNYNVRMILDNYESSMPKVLYLRNEKVMVEGEMADIDNFDLRESQRQQMDEVSQILYEAGDLLLVYDEIKARQLQYLQKIIALKNTLRSKYFDLQKEVDTYNKYKVERNLTLLPDVLDKGSINEVLETTLKDQYNMYIAERPSLEEIKDFIKQVWDLNMNLELNTKYYEAQKEENDIRNEIKVVDKKLELMESLKEELKPLFGIDLVGRFKKINEECRKESKYMSKNFIEERLALVNKKYEVYDKLDLYYASDYLREAFQNTNYDDLAIKYSTKANEETINKGRLPLNDIVSDLAIQYRDKLNSEEQSILVLYNNSKFAKMFDAILEVDNFDQAPLKDVLKKINAIKGISKIKTECYENVKKRIDDPVNANVKQTLFSNVDFTTFDTYIASLVKKLANLKNVNNKMTIKSDFNMYTLVNKADDLAKRKFISVTNDLNTMLNEAKESHAMIGICLLKDRLPVLYSPYYFDLGDMYSKGASPLMEIKEMVTFDLLIDKADISIYQDENKVEVNRYYTEPKVSENISYVDDIKFSYSTVFCKFSLVSTLPVSEEVPVSSTVTAQAQPEPVKQVTSVATPVTPEVKEEVPKEESASVVTEAKVEEPKLESAPIVAEEKVEEPKAENTPVVEESKTEVVVPPKEATTVDVTEPVPVEQPNKQPTEEQSAVTVTPIVEEKQEEVVAPVEEKKDEIKEEPVKESSKVPVKEEPKTQENQPEIKEEPPKVEEKPKEENGFVDLAKASTSTQGKQTLSLDDFKPTTIIEEPPKPVDTQKPKNVKVIKKVGSIGSAAPVKKEPLVNSPVNNVETPKVETPKPTTNVNSGQPKKNIVVKSVGSIGKPLNKK